MRVIVAGIGLCILTVTSTFALEKKIDKTRSSLTIHVQKTGLLSAAGHEHTVTAPVEDGFIDDGDQPRITFRVLSQALRVSPEEHQMQVQSTMQEKVLESSTYPEIRFASLSIKPVGDGKWLVVGEIALHGKTNTIQINVEKRGEGYSGETVIKQRDFGIRPVSAAGGTVKVKDELTISFVFVTVE